MIKGDYAMLTQIAGTHVCPEHGTLVVVTWYGPQKCWTLRCDHGTHIEPAHHVPGGVYSEDSVLPGHYPEEVTRQLSLTEAYKAGEHIDEPIRANIEKGMRRRKMEQKQGTKGVMIAGRPAVDLGTGELLSGDKVKSLVRFAQAVGLDIRLDHVCIMYGEPYVTHNGYLYLANKRKIRYTLTGRVLSGQELEALSYTTNDLGWKATFKRLDTNQEFEGYGFVTLAERTEESKKKPGQLAAPVVAEKPGVMVVKRAEWQALKRGVPLSIDQELEHEAGD